jgi:mono/diheme cytochrome c family protein
MRRRRLSAVLASAILATFATRASADDLSSSQQNALVQKYCAVCHSDAANNGGLSLQHYDAARPDPPLAAMLLSKLRNGAMGAAGVGVPDKDTQAAWILATVRQALGAQNWAVSRSGSSQGSTVTASVVRIVSPRHAEANPPIYRLTIACDAATRQGAMQLTWSPEPQTDRTFLVSSDGQPGVPHTLSGKEKMGNGTSGTSGRASVALQIAMPAKSLTITDLFPSETVVFPFDSLDRETLRELAACNSGPARN